MCSVKTKTTVSFLENGDIFFCLPAPFLNEWMGSEILETGNEMLCVAMDTSEAYDGIIKIQGGFSLKLEQNQDVWVLSHYSEILNAIEDYTEDL